MNVHRCGLYPNVKRSETASAVVRFEMPWCCEEPLAILVHNTKEERPPEKGGGVKPANWGCPGGGLKPGESPEQAVLRELRQETGITAPEGSARQVFFRHSFMFERDSNGRSPAYENCRDVMEAIRLGRVDDREIVHQSWNWAFHVETSPSEALLKYFLGRWFALSLGETQSPEEKEYGALVVTLDNERAEELGIVEAIEGPGGRREIDAIGLFPVSQLARIRDDGAPGFSRGHMGYVIASLRP